MESNLSGAGTINVWRRRLLQGLGVAGAAAGLGPFARLASAAEDAVGAVQPQVLRGTEFDLEIAPMPVNITGAPRIATAINGQVPGPILYWREGDTVTLRVTNRLPVRTSIHWHGILLPANMDGVPGLSFDGIAPGETFVYRFEVRQSGTYWYHSHSAFQEQTGVYGPIVIEPRSGERVHSDREHVVLLSDWTDERPEVLLANLKKMSDFFNYRQPTAGDFLRDVSNMGLRAALKKRQMWNRMRMNPTDFSDVGAAGNSAANFTYLMNGLPAARNWTGLFRPGEKLRLRIINGSATSIFDVRIPGLKLTVIAADGQDVEPVEVDEFRISVAEVYDVLVEPREERAYTLFAQSIDRSGYVRGTLAPRPGMQAAVPAVDQPQWLAMTDMMGDMPTEGMTHDGSMAMRGAATPPVRHAASEYGPHVDMHVDMPRTGLDDPGVNLRDNGRRVLTYADLHTLGGPLDLRAPTRDIELHLTGHMERFIWSFDGQKFSEAKPIHFRYGERLRLIIVNDTMMNHPIHLHGMWSELESPDGAFQVRKHTINVQPAQRIVYRVTADAPGRWAYHCHLMYHMEAGMFREVVVS